MQLQIQPATEFKKEYTGIKLNPPVQKANAIPYVPKQDNNTDRMQGVRTVLNSRKVFPVDSEQEQLKSLWDALHACNHGKRVQIMFTNKHERIKMMDWVCDVVKDYNVHNFKNLRVVKLIKLNKWVGLGVR